MLDAARKMNEVLPASRINQTRSFVHASTRLMEDGPKLPSTVGPCRILLARPLTPFVILVSFLTAVKTTSPFVPVAGETGPGSQFMQLWSCGRKQRCTGTQVHSRQKSRRNSKESSRRRRVNKQHLYALATQPQ